MKKTTLVLGILAAAVLGLTAYGEEETVTGGKGEVTLIEEAEDMKEAGLPENTEPYFPRGESDGKIDKGDAIDHNTDRAVIGSDDRVTIYDTYAYPYSAIARIEMHYSCGCSGTGTGFMVSQEWLMTAGHCLVCTDHHQWADALTFYFGYQSNGSYSHIYNDYWHGWAGSYVFDEVNYASDRANDYGYIHFDNEAVGEYTGWFGMMPKNRNIGDVEYYNVAGYRDGSLKWDYDRTEYQENVLFCYYDAVAGNSGGPVYTDDYYAVGIHVAEAFDGTYNLACPITSDILNYMRNNGF